MFNVNNIVSLARGGSTGVQKERFVFTFKICLPHPSVTSFLRGAAPPKKILGTAPAGVQVRVRLLSQKSSKLFSWVVKVE